MMVKIAVTFSPDVGGASVFSLRKSFAAVGCDVFDADYREMMRLIPKEEFESAYKTFEGRRKLFAHAKAQAEKILDKVDCIALSGNSSMVDPTLFYQKRSKSENYDLSRTIAELALVHVATQRGMPIMGFCGGHQVIAVYSGGTLRKLSPSELDKQQYLRYEAIVFNKESMLAKILDPGYKDSDLQKEFLGAHFQIVDKLGDNFEENASGVASGLNEGAESKYGTPIITTQFHPEVSLYGYPKSKLLYERSKAEKEVGLRVFDAFRVAGETYRKKKTVLEELKQLKPFDDRLLSPSEVKEWSRQNHSQESKPIKASKPIKTKETYRIIGVILAALFFIAFPLTGLLGSASIAFFAVRLPKFLSSVYEKAKNFLRNIISKTVTDKYLEKQQKFQDSQLESEDPIESSYQKILPISEMGVKMKNPTPTPMEIIREVPARLWENKLDKSEEETTCSFLNPNIT